MDVESRPDSDRVAQEVFERLLHWSERVRSPRWVVAWKKWSFVAPLLVWLPLSIVGVTFISTESQRNTAAWRQEAWQLLDDGLAPEEQKRALEILLASQAQYPAPKATGLLQSTSPQLRRIRVFGIALTLALLAWANPPKEHDWRRTRGE